MIKEDIHGNTLTKGDLAVNSYGYLFKLEIGHFKGITANSDSWFKTLTRVINVDDVIRTTSIKLKKSL